MEILQWAIPIIVGILGILVGREWQKHARTIEKDKITFAKTLEILPSDGSVFFIRTHSFGSAFKPIEDLKDFFIFRDYCSRPEFFYLDKELESLKGELLESFKKLDARIFAETSSAGLNPGFYRLRLPEDYPEIDYEKFYSVENELNILASHVCEKYDQLIKTAHKKL